MLHLIYQVHPHKAFIYQIIMSVSPFVLSLYYFSSIYMRVPRGPLLIAGKILSRVTVWPVLLFSFLFCIQFHKAKKPVFRKTQLTNLLNLKRYIEVPWCANIP